MEGFSIEIAKRDVTSRAMTRRLRKDGNIPVVVYHRGENSMSASVSYKEFEKLAKQAKISQVFLFKSSEGSLNGRSALVRDIQQDYISGKVIHVDFQALKDDEKIKVTVPLHFLGDPIGVKTEGGMLSVHSHELEVSCLPKDIPLVIDIDISMMKINTHMHANNLPLPEGVSLARPSTQPIVSVVTMKEEKPEPTAVAADAAAVAGAAAATAAAAPAADAAKAPAGKK